MVVLAAVDCGGTTFKLALAVGEPSNIVEQTDIPTTTPKETLAKVCEWLGKKHYDALGVACFGPVDLHPESKTYGYITTTPKPHWQNTDILSPLREVRDVPFGFDTDVNAPAYAEYEYSKRSGKMLSSCAYITVGTGIGVGLVVNDLPVHGLMHPEGGHICVPQHPNDAATKFQGSNPRDCFGGLCVENLSCSVALAKRAGLPGTEGLRELPDAHSVWDAAAHYLGALCANLVLMVSPERIVLGGGIMQRASLFRRIRAETQKQLNGYLQLPELATSEGIADLIVASTWGNNAGLVGALTLADKARQESMRSRGDGSSPLLARKWIDRAFALVAILSVASASFALGASMRRR